VDIVRLPAHIEIGFSSKFASQDDHYKVAVMALQLAIVGSWQRFYPWEKVSAHQSRQSLMTIPQVLSDPTSGQGQDREPELIIVAPPAKTGSKPRVQGKGRVTKKEKKALGSPPTLPPINQGSREESSISEGGSRSETFDQPHFIPKGQSFAMGSQYLSSILSNDPPAPTLPHNPSQCQQPAPPAESTLNYNHQQAGQSDRGPAEIPVPSAQPYQPSQPASYSSRIEDVVMAPNSGSQQRGAAPGQQYIRSQYIMAMQDSVWRATR
jgi:hypothetical protein